MPHSQICFTTPVTQKALIFSLMSSEQIIITPMEKAIKYKNLLKLDLEAFERRGRNI